MNDCRQASTGELTGSCREWRSCAVDKAKSDPSERSNLGRGKPQDSNSPMVTLTSTLEEREEEEVKETLKGSTVKKTKVENEEGKEN